MIKFNARKFATVAIAQSTEGDRYYLRGVFLEGKRAVATDGHILIAAQDDDAVIEAPGLYPCSKAALTAAKKPKADHITIDGNILRVCTEDGEAYYMEPCLPIDGTFPAWQRVIPTKLGEATHAAFAPAALTRILAAAKHISEDTVPIVRLTGEDAASPHIAYFGVSDTIGVIMPCRAPAIDVLPCWVHDPRDERGS